MIALSLLLALAAPSRAQVAPAPPEAPAPAAAVSPEKLDDVFRRFTSGRPMIPTLKEVRKAREREDLTPRSAAAAPAVAADNVDLIRSGLPPQNSELRMTDTKVDVSVTRPAPRVELGVGYSQNDTYAGSVHTQGGASQYAFLHFNISRTIPARRLVHAPTAVYTESELGNQVRVSNDDYTIHSLSNR